MRSRMTMMLAAGVLAATPAAAWQAGQVGDAAAATSPGQKGLAEQCTARKFETTVLLPGRSSRVRICGKPGQTSAEWIETLRDSVRKTEASEAMAPAVRKQIVAALKAEIAALESPAVAGLAPPAGIARIQIEPAPVEAREPQPRYSSLPPLPTPKKAPPVAFGGSHVGGAASAPTALSLPRLRVRCAVPGQSYGECGELDSNIALAVFAEENLAAGTSLRFVRRDKPRAEIDLSGLQKGQSLRRKLPDSVCSGVIRSKVEIEIVSKGRVADTLGPYPLNCGS